MARKSGVRASSRCAVALRGRLRRDRVLALHRARDRGALGARADAACPIRSGRRSSSSSRCRTRKGRRRSRRSGRGHVRAPRVQRPGRLRDRLGALPRLPHRDGALGALRPALSRRGDRRPSLRRVPVGRGRRRGVIVVSRAFGSSRRTRALLGASSSRVLDLVVQSVLVVLGLALLLSPDELADGLDLARARMGRPRVRAAAGDARVHGARDGREPRGGGARAGSHAAAVALLRDRSRRRRDRADRRDRALRIPGRRRDRARRGVARGAARRDRAAFEGMLPRFSSTRCESPWGSRAS